MTGRRAGRALRARIARLRAGAARAAAARAAAARVDAPGRLLALLAPGLLLRRGHASDRLRGLAGERLAARALRAAGARVLARRLATRSAELDLVLREGSTLVCVEVKTGRAGPRFRPADRHAQRVLGRQSDAAHDLARALGCASWRVDLVEVLTEPRHAPRLVRRARAAGAVRGTRVPPPGNG